MKLVVEINEEIYKDIKKGKVYSSIRDVPQESVLAIANGIPLPKGHGRLIDADELMHWYGNPDIEILLENMNTIIEADVESE